MAHLTSIKAQLFKELTYINDQIKGKTVSFIKSKVFERKAQKIEESFQSVKNDILTYNASLSKEDAKDAVSTKDFSTFSVLFDTIYEGCLQVQDDHANSQTAAVISASKVSLPKISIPNFTGNISEWNQFYELFVSLCHNNKGLSDIEKFQFLKTNLKGEALAVVSNYEFTATNYASAFNALVDRFANKRRLAAFYVQKLLRFTQNGKKEITELLETHRAAEAGLKNMKLADLSDFFLFEITYNNCPDNIKRSFDQTYSGTAIPTFKDIIQHAELHARTKELQSDSGVIITKKPEVKPFKPTSKSQNYVAQSKGINCGFCGAEHYIYSCEGFKKISPAERFQAAKANHLCYNCLGSHSIKVCASKSTCRVCSKRHHTLIHLPETGEKEVDRESSKPPSAAMSCTSRSQVEVLLGTISCLVKDANGCLQPVRVLLDNGSQRSLVTAKLARRLGLRIKPESRIISGICQSNEKTKGVVKLELHSKTATACRYECNATVITQICGRIPSAPLSSELRAKFQNLELADPQFFKSSEIDILLDAQAYASLLVPDSPNIIVGHPSAVKTKFGWAVFGATQETHADHSSVTLLTQSSNLEDNLTRFWEIEEVSVPRSAYSLEEQYVETQFVKCHTRDEEGRFVVRLPFIPGTDPLKLNNESSAYKSYLNLESRLSRKPQMQEMYKAFMGEFYSMGHMLPAKDTVSKYIMPHHCVMKDSTSTKLRCVFNASATDAFGESLNSLLYPGPKLQTDLSDILLRLRYGAVALFADIKMMFRQIKVHPDDAVFQQVFWRPDNGGPVQTFQIQRIVYGMTPSSYLAQRCLRQLAEEVKTSKPRIAAILERDVFMDDFAFSLDSVCDAVKVRDQLTKLLDSAGFPLRKWSSSHPEALDGLSRDHKETPLEFSSEPTVKILGLCWHPGEDTLGYSVRRFEGPATKRKILSYISCIFDPLGLLCPVVSYAKQFLQYLFLLKVDWDEVLPDELTSKWWSYLNHFETLKEIRIPRYLNTANAELHLAGFSDSSESSYAASIYLQVFKEGTWSSHLIKAKSRVAPLKRQSIPRLELLGALLLARLVDSVISATQNRVYVSTTLFTDSTIVLAWLKMPSYRLKTFVGNRVAAILELTPNAKWTHVRTSWNASDCASRGIPPEQLLNHPLWWSGPDFLQQGPAYLAVSSYEDPVEVPEVKEEKVMVTLSPKEDSILTRFSTLSRLVRVVAWMKRFANNSTSKQRLSGPLAVHEIKSARECCIRLSQQEDFAGDIAALKAGKSVSVRIRKLTPFLCEQGLLKVGGRLEHSQLRPDSKHPILLSKASPLSALICDDYHRKLLHSGPRTTKAFILRQFWILSLNSLLRKVIYRCKPCYRLSANPVQPIMGDLPAERVSVSHPFQNTGVDFAGPFSTKESTMRKSVMHKSYFSIFVCQSTKAIHLEAVSDLTTQAFLACLQRFVARRGNPALIYSDSGRNFIGAARSLKECAQFLRDNHDNILTHLSTLDIVWRNAPPTGSHFGGLYEAGVKSCKLLLKRLIGDQVLTFEEFATVLARVEAVLNSRPLTEAPLMPQDSCDYLSVGHILIGRPLTAPPEIPVDDKCTPTQRWERVRHIGQQFWKRWSKEYLNTLMQREKWTKANENIKCGQLVYIVGEKTTPLSWPLGKVVATHPGRDNVVRVVSVQTGSGTYVRPVNKLVLLH